MVFMGSEDLVFKLPSVGDDDDGLLSAVSVSRGLSLSTTNSFCSDRKKELLINEFSQFYAILGDFEVKSPKTF